MHLPSRGTVFRKQFTSIRLSWLDLMDRWARFIGMKQQVRCQHSQSRPAWFNGAHVGFICDTCQRIIPHLDSQWMQSLSWNKKMDLLSFIHANKFQTDLNYRSLKRSDVLFPSEPEERAQLKSEGSGRIGGKGEKVL
ncbi:hypothetical protein SAMN04488112_103203 [Melghirimyces thermohalophilus]|uniref:Uncharacterized protein n=1 Tax=Melghirimyces thermohalophilus TaxID=1236220 RepID=A0A1G6J6N5_9BACL|nr:hypothetical protein SAMN04488112_103203 [Melghirimyces thermohalophilus]